VGDRHTREGASGLIEIDGTRIAPPLTAGQARSLGAFGLLADEPENMLEVWHRVVWTWAAELDAAKQDPGEARLGDRVDGEWSLVETLRHLRFVTDGWIGRGVLGSDEYHPLGLPPDFVTNGRELGLRLDAEPDLETVLVARTEGQQLVARALEGASNLDSPCLGPLSAFTLRGAFQVVIAEEWFHLGFARRDLGRLRSP